MEKTLINPVIASDDLTVAALDCSCESVFCSDSADAYEAMVERIEDLELVTLCRERENDPTVKVWIDIL